MRAPVVITVLVTLVICRPAVAQEPFNVAVPVTTLASIFSDLYGPEGLIVDSLAELPGGETHSAHFNSGFQANFVQFGTAVAGRLVTIPLPSPASGFTYEFDPSLGVFSRTTESFGPILAERAETIGRGRTSFGFAYQRFAFDTIEGLDLSDVPAVFTHDDFELRGGRDDLVTTTNAIDATINQLTVFLTYGVSDQLDVSIGVPIVNTDLRVVSDAWVRRLGTENPEVHFFRSLNDSVGNRRIFTAIGSATGIGDVTVRLKGALTQGVRHRTAVGVDVRIPTGDEQNLLGAGGPGIKPFAVWSTSVLGMFPHANAGYLWNGSSALAGDPLTGEADDLPDQGFYTVGVDIPMGPRLTVAMDLLGRVSVDAPRLVPRSFRSLNGVSVFPDIGFVEETFAEHDAAVGFKLNLAGEVLLDFNVLFRLDSSGLRDKVTPLIGVEYAL